MSYTIHIARSAEGGRSRFQTYTLDLAPEMTVLDALFAIQHDLDPTIAFRCACRVGMCGTCAVQVNGVSRLACKTRLTDLGSKDVTLTSLPHFPVIRDLAVSLKPFFDKWRSILPALRPRDPESQELARIPADSAYAQRTPGKRDCITCGACFAACGISGINSHYLGPAAINKALLRILDPRDTAHRQRLQTLDDSHSGVWRCHTQFNCVAVCPKGIDLTDTIAFFKRVLLLPLGRLD